LLARIKAAGLEAPGVDDERLVKEIFYFADRSDVSEELTRLQSHFQQFDDCVKSGEPIGRTLDFLAQEINREINTLGSKANDSVISREVVLVAQGRVGKVPRTSAERGMSAPLPEPPAAGATPLLIVLSAPSGGGKTTLCQQLLAAHPEMTRVITCTTRPPRAGEIEGRDYYFLNEEEFSKRIEFGSFLEHARVHDRSYGTPKAEVINMLRSGKDVLLNIDVQGAATICSRAAADADLRHALVTVFLTPSSVGQLEARLRRRGTDSPAQLEKRLGVARHEIAQWRHFEYLIISTTIAEDLRLMEAIIVAERMRCSRSKFTVKD
jgi:guanylate kinase